MEFVNGVLKIDVLFGVNGYIWISKYVEGEISVEVVGINCMEEIVSSKVYLS